MTYLLIDTATALPMVATSDGRYFVEVDEPIADLSTWLILELRRFSQTEFAKDLRGVVVGTGPGSYTGLRVAMAAAKIWCYARNLPLCGVSSLCALAPGARGIRSLRDRGLLRLALAADARAGGLYIRLGDIEKEGGVRVRWSPPQRVSWENLIEFSRDIDAVFCDWPPLREKWKMAGGRAVKWHRVLPRIGGFVDALESCGSWGRPENCFQEVEVLYLRGPIYGS